MLRTALRSGAVTWLALLSALWLRPAPARGDGLIRQLPEDGTWVRYDATLQKYDPRTGKPGQKYTATQTISSVGRKIVDGETCRMIELKCVIDRNEGFDG